MLSGNLVVGRISNDSHWVRARAMAINRVYTGPAVARIHGIGASLEEARTRSPRTGGARHRSRPAADKEHAAQSQRSPVFLEDQVADPGEDGVVPREGCAGRPRPLTGVPEFGRSAGRWQRPQREPSKGRKQLVQWSKRSTCSGHLSGV